VYQPGVRDHLVPHSSCGVRSFVPEVSIVTVMDIFQDGFNEVFNSLCSQSLQSLEWFIIVEADQKPLFNAAILTLDIPEYLDIHLLTDSPDPSGGAAWIEAVGLSRGKFLCLLDADTLLTPTYIEKSIWFLDTSSNASFCNSYQEGSKKKETCYLSQGGSFVEQLLCCHRNIILRTLTVQAIVAENFMPVRGMELIDLLLSLANHRQWGLTLPEYLCRQHVDDTDSIDISIVKKLIREKYPSVYDRFTEVTLDEHQPYAPLCTEVPVYNTRVPESDGLQLMLLIPWMVTGGADKFNLDLVEMLVNRGHRVTVCATLDEEQPWEHRFQNFTPDVFVLRRFIPPHDFPRFLVYLIRSRCIDTVVISGSSIGYQLLAYLRAHAPDTSFLDLCHVEEPDWNSGGHPRFAVGYQDMLELNIVSTHHLADWMVEKGADRERIRVLHTGVDEFSHAIVQQTRQRIRDEFAIPDDYSVMIFGGRICKQKRPDFLVKILKDIREKGLSFYVFIVGDGELRPLLESMLDEYDLRSSVQMCGSLPHARWLDLLHASDLFLLPSSYEGISIALLEAMAAGVVPVVSDVGGQKEIVQGGAGYLIAHGDDEQERYVEVLNEALADAPLRRKMGTKARDLIRRNFSRSATLSTFETVVAESHSLLRDAPRVAIPKGLATEMAVTAIEIERLNGAVNWLWERGGGVHDDFSGVLNWLRALKSSHLGEMLYRNRLLRRLLVFCFRSKT